VAHRDTGQLAGAAALAARFGGGGGLPTHTSPSTGSPRGQTKGQIRLLIPRTALIASQRHIVGQAYESELLEAVRGGLGRVVELAVDGPVEAADAFKLELK
jgi:hypothetical protein